MSETLDIIRTLSEVYSMQILCDEVRQRYVAVSVYWFPPPIKLTTTKSLIF